MIHCSRISETSDSCCSHLTIRSSNGFLKGREQHGLGHDDVVVQLLRHRLVDGDDVRARLAVGLDHHLRVLPFAHHLVEGLFN